MNHAREEPVPAFANQHCSSYVVESTREKQRYLKHGAHHHVMHLPVDDTSQTEPKLGFGKDEFAKPTWTVQAYVPDCLLVPSLLDDR